MLKKLLLTESTLAMTILRISLGVVIFPHGAQKLLGMFGGYGFTATMHHFTESMGIPHIFALAAILAESVGAVALIAGLGTRIAALGVAATISVGALMHLQHGFFMNWFGKQAGEGIEYHLLVIGMAAALTVAGGGKWSVDHMISRKL